MTFTSRKCSALFVSVRVTANGVTRFGLTHEAIKPARLSVPSLPEQSIIATHLDKVTAAIDNTRCQVELIWEYRARLISRMVTGKLDMHAIAQQIRMELRQA
jgi:type I restriction enzyme S subunit